MIDYGRWMRRSYEHYLVDPATWCDAERLWCIERGAKLTLDSEADLGGRASYKATRILGECYVRTYMVCEQNGETERHPLGTWLAQTSAVTHNGCREEVEVDAYPPLKELADDGPAASWYVAAGGDAAEAGGRIAALHCRAPSCVTGGGLALADTWAAKGGETWLELAQGLLEQCGMRLMPDWSGQVVGLVKRDAGSMAPVASFDDANASVVQRGKKIVYDLYDVPNKVTVSCTADGSTATATAVNDDPASPLSTVSRGRVKSVSETVSDIACAPGQLQAAVARRARERLRELSMAERRTTYKRAWRPDVRVGDCVRLDFSRPEVHTRAVVVSQEIECTPAGQVTETAVWKEELL